jgi:23S rRNA C2498 (ribose-2'-O)-methylase RlmM
LSKAGIHHTLHIKQLYHDREEVTACLITATPESSR